MLRDLLIPKFRIVMLAIQALAYVRDFESKCGFRNARNAPPGLAGHKHEPKWPK
jgi:hypothetical protein